MRIFTIAFITLSCQASYLFCQNNSDQYLFSFPENRSDRPAFRQLVTNWRNEIIKGYAEKIYTDSSLQWTQGIYLVAGSKPWSSLIVGQDGKSNIGVHAGYYNKRFGGADLLLLKNGSPLLGLDMKNQWDIYRSYVPFDGQNFKGLTEIVADYKRISGGRVAFSYSLLDLMTKREPVSDMDMLIIMLSETGMDAASWDRVDESYTVASDTIRKTRSGAVLIASHPPELHNPDFIKQVAEVPLSVLRISEEEYWGLIIPRWLERRHCTSILDEGYSTTNTIMHALQLGFVNGCGWLIEEESDYRARLLSGRDVSWIRLALPVLRRYQELFTNQSQDGWIPCIDTENDHICGSLWQKERTRIWTLVNHSDEEISDTIIRIQHVKGTRYFDLIKGVKIEADTTRKEIFITDDIASNGLACYLATSHPDSALLDFLYSQADIFDLSDWNTSSKQKIVEVKPVRLTPRNELPPKMFSFTYSVTVDLPSYSYLEPAGQGSDGEGAQVTLQPYAIDIDPVTNREWLRFINESGYVPENTDRYLLHWQGGYRGQPEPGKEDYPVIWISLKDAQTYATFYNKRLPTRFEFQYAQMKGVIRNGQYHYWNLTGDVYSNMFSRWVYLKGGTEFSRTDAQGESAVTGVIYAPDAADPGLATNESGVLDIFDPATAWELFLGPPAMQRSGTIGFRCAVDLR